MKLRKLLFIIFLFGITSNVNAQLWKKLKKKVTDKVEKKLENKIDKQTDKIINNTLDGKKKEKESKIIQSTELPKLLGGSGILKLYNFGYEYVTKDIGISVYGKFTKENLSSSEKTYNQDKVIKPVDAYPEGYALAFNGSGFLNPKEARIIIHHADSTKVVFSIKGTWNTVEGNKPITGSYISLNVSEIIDKRNVNEPNNNEKENTVYNNTPNKKSNLSLHKKTTNSSVKIPSTFSFSSSIEVKMTTNDGSNADIEFLLGNYSNIYAMSLASNEGGKVYNVITPKSITMFMDIGGMKMKKTVSQEQFSQSTISDKVPTDPNHLKKTGESKTILGFTCYEYKYTNNGGYVSVWITKDFPSNSTNISMLGMHEGGVIDGFVLEIDSKSGNDKANMKVVKYNKNKKITINTSSYKLMGF